MTEEEYLDKAEVKLRLLHRYNVSDANFFYPVSMIVNIILSENQSMMEDNPVYRELALSRDEDNALILAYMLLQDEHKQ